MAQLLDMASERELKMWNALKLGYTDSQGEKIVFHEDAVENVSVKSPCSFFLRLRTVKSGNCLYVVSQLHDG